MNLTSVYPAGLGDGCSCRWRRGDGVGRDGAVRAVAALVRRPPAAAAAPDAAAAAAAAVGRHSFEAGKKEYVSSLDIFHVRQVVDRVKFTLKCFPTFCLHG